MKRSHLVSLLVIAAFVLCLPATAVAKKKPKIATGPMDDGRLIPEWFGEGLEFHEHDDLDYLWVKPGFSLDGKSLHFEQWPEPEFLGEDADDRSDEDHDLAKTMYNDMAEMFTDAFNEAFGDRLSASTEEGDILVSGRIVDCNTGSTAAKIMIGFGAGSGGTTVDLKFTDKETGELLVAIHHQVVSGTTWSTTDSKFSKWTGKFAEFVAKKGLATIYDKGDPTDE